MEVSRIARIISDYEHLANHIAELIEISGYRNDYIAKKMGLTTANFSAKKNRKSFSIEEVRKIASIINNEDVEDYFLMREMNARKDEETISHEELYKKMGWS